MAVFLLKIIDIQTIVQTNHLGIAFDTRG